MGRNRGKATGKTNGKSKREKEEEGKKSKKSKKREPTGKGCNEIANKNTVQNTGHRGGRKKRAGIFVMGLKRRRYGSGSRSERRQFARATGEKIVGGCGLCPKLL